MRMRDRATLYCFTAFSIFMCLESWRLGLGTFSTPGPGFLPFGASAVIGLIAISLLVLGRKQRVVSTEPFFKREGIFNLLIVLCLIFGYVFLLYYIGFFLCTLLFVLCCIRFIERRKWGVVIGTSIVTAVVAWLLFDYWLMVQLPKGIWVGPFFEKIWGFLWK